MPAAQSKSTSRWNMSHRFGSPSVLLPERLAAGLSRRVAPSAPGKRASPESHPRTVLIPGGTPESVTPSAGLDHFPVRFVCPYSITMLLYHKILPFVNVWRTTMRWMWNFQLFEPREQNFSRRKFTICSFFAGKSVIY